MVMAIALITACQNSSSTSSTTPSDCRMVRHAAGETCVPLQPTRIVALDSVTLEFLTALGIKPVGAPISDGFATRLQQDWTGVEDLGATGEPSLEKALALQPDLIVGGDYYQKVYSQASQIAPTLLFKSEHSGQWKEVFMTVAQMLGKTEAAEQVMADYDARLAELQQQMGDRLSQTQVSVVRVYPDYINLYLQDSFCGKVLQDAGLPRPEAQAIAADKASQLFDNPIQVSISREVLHQADGDVMFVWTGENTPEAKHQADQKLNELSADPLWQQLKAVKQGKVYRVPNYWIGSGPIAANLVIDDLFKYLVERA
ncbi:iron-siderophore ABC transporter substrate-binding protein [Leptolyngbya sp. FACHB-16]|nr:iron-siderophore ABC transporter substrate-binding protein [Leptolyngbya sp. FACHB-8]MBD2156979.1 iron-siderophore ABC transporter substrate-binding protein [Leptolyngbya sp. FACHB-16]